MERSGVRHTANANQPYLKRIRGKMSALEAANEKYWLASNKKRVRW